MAWTDPAGHVWVTGEVVTAANMNTYVRLNLEALRGTPTAAVTNAAISVPTGGAGTYMTFSSESWDNDGIHSTSVNTGRLTCVTAGVNDVTGYLYYAGNATGTKRNLAIRLNGATFPTGCEVNGNPDGVNAIGVELTLPLKLIVGDYVELRAFHDAGVALNVTPRFAMTWRSTG